MFFCRGFNTLRDHVLVYVDPKTRPPYQPIAFTKHKHPVLAGHSASGGIGVLPPLFCNRFRKKWACMIRCPSSYSGFAYPHSNYDIAKVCTDCL